MGKDSLFCKIIRGEKPAEFLYRDESPVVFRDIYAGAPIHFLTDVVSLLPRPLKATSLSV
jgi:diadenosine tetraphosphate (Ap4A) HIT family hydrolase